MMPLGGLTPGAALALLALLSERRFSRDPSPPALPVSQPQSPLPTMRAGRNESCPCGSGKKFKKCCRRVK